jgi:hypothetical protein
MLSRRSGHRSVLHDLSEKPLLRGHDSCRRIEAPLQQVPPADCQSSLSYINFDSDVSEVVDFAENADLEPVCDRPSQIFHIQLTPWELGLGKQQVKIWPVQ